jgi:type I restriction enzyme, S subunit
VIADLTPYAEYQPTGSPWLGDVPAHWQVRPAFGAYAPIHERNTGMREKTVLSLSYGRIIVKPAEKLRGLVPESFETYQIVNPGDIVVRTTDLQNDHTSLRVGIVRDRGIITSAYLALRTAQDVLPAYGYQLLNVWDGTKAIYGYGSGLRQNLDFSHFKRMPVPVPPPEEQAAIVRFLGWASGRLERAIRAKRNVIALLEEQRQARLFELVTGTITSSAKKPTGLPWLPEMPSHWKLEPNRAWLRIRKQVVGDRHGEYQLLSLTKRGVVVRDVSENKGKFSSDPGSQQIVRSGDMVLCLFDVPETPRTVGLSWVSGMITGAYTVLECSSVLEARFLEAFYIAMDDRKLLSPLYSGLRNTIPKERFLGAKTPMPTPPEMEEILQSVDAERRTAEERIQTFLHEIEMLREYRIRLIADVVAGRLDVRRAANEMTEGSPPESAVAEEEESIP